MFLTVISPLVSEAQLGEVAVKKDVDLYSRRIKLIAIVSEHGMIICLRNY